MITKENLQQLKNKLEEEKNDILTELKRHESMPDFGSDIDSLEEEADESAEYVNQLALVQTLKNRLADIEFALKKINNGDYGICENCKKEISLEVLDVDPESKLCQNCKMMK